MTIFFHSIHPESYSVADDWLKPLLPIWGGEGRARRLFNVLITGLKKYIFRPLLSLHLLLARAGEVELELES